MSNTNRFVIPFDTEWNLTADNTTIGTLVQDDIPRLFPGDGFDNPLPDPQQIGQPTDSRGTARAIARWTTVPKIGFTTDINVGLVAFHANYIDKVVFEVNGGAAVEVSQMLENPETGVYEYVALIKAEDFQNNEEVTVRATAYPKNAGETRSMELTLFARKNDDTPKYYISPTGDDGTGDGTVGNPFQTVRGALAYNAQALFDEITVYHLAGTYTWGAGGSWGSWTNADKGWLNIEAAPGVARDDVVYNNWASPNLKMNGIKNIHVKGIKLINLRDQDASEIAWKPLGTSGQEESFWYDNCYLDGMGRFKGKWQVNFDYAYFTESECHNAVNAHIRSALVRNCVTVGISGDVYSSSDCVVNCSCNWGWREYGTGIDNGRGDEYDEPISEPNHPDMIQLYSTSAPIENQIYYNIRAWDFNGAGIRVQDANDGQGADLGIRDIAFVNMNFNSGNRDPAHAATMEEFTYDHFIFDNVNLLGTKFNVGFGNSSLTVADMPWTDIVIRSSLFNSFDIYTGDGTFDDYGDKVTIENCHFIIDSDGGGNSWVYGSNPTTGDALLTNAAYPYTLNEAGSWDSGEVWYDGTPEDYNPAPWGPYPDTQDNTPLFNSPLIKRNVPIAPLASPVGQDNNKRLWPTAVGALERSY